MSARVITLIETCGSTPHLETSFEISKRHLEAGDIVNYHYIGHKLPFNDFPKPLETCLFLKSSPAILGAKILAHTRFRFSLGKNFRKNNNIALPTFQTPAELKQFKYKEFNAGLSCWSSLVSNLRTPWPCVSKNKSLINTILISGISTYEYTLSVLRNERPTMVYLFNGRFAINRAIFDAAVSLKTPYMVHERGANKYRYSAAPHLPQNLDLFQEDMLKAWEKERDTIKKTSLGSTYFQHQRDAVEQGWASFTVDQTRGRGLDIDLSSKRLITYFSSSLDEIAFVEHEIDWGPWGDQLNAVRNLLHIVGDNPRFELAIRLHPHLKRKNNDELNTWLQLQLPRNASIIMPDSSIDTYTLMEQSAAVVTFGSSTGIESVYWNTPSICLGPSAYSTLGAVYLPQNNDELRSLLLNPHLKAERSKALPYGYFMKTWGEEFKYYKPETLFRGAFMGVNLQEEHTVRRLKNGLESAKRTLEPLASRFRYKKAKAVML